MATQVQWRGGSTAEHSTFTGAAREVTVDTQKKTLVVHDGSTAGGEPLLREDGSNSAFNLGTAATPALKFTGDTNTGIYSPGADQVAISTNGTGRLFVDSAGVITTDNGFTSSRFNVVNTNTVSTYDRMLLFRSNNLSNGYIGLGSDSFYIASASNAPLVFCTNSDGGVSGSSVPTNERLRITSDGKLGLGSSNPTAKFVCDGSIQVTNSTNPSAGAGLEIGYGTVSASRTALQSYNRTGSAWLGADYNALDHRFYISGGGSPQMTLTSTGLGIGTTPDSPLHVAGTGGTSMRIGYTNNTNYFDANTQVFRSNNATTTYGQWDSSGRFLVGTSTSLGVDALLQLSSTGASSRGKTEWLHWEASSGGPQITLSKSRGSSAGSFTVVSVDDELGGVYFRGANGTAFGYGASVKAEADGTWGSSDHPSRLVFSTTADGASSPTERMRIGSNGEQRINTTNQVNAGFISLLFSGATHCAYGVADSQTDGDYFRFFRSTSTQVGAITHTSTATVYSTSSDYRLKENVVPLTGATDRVKQLKPSKFNFKADPTTTVDGFIAHEAQAVVPECVTGEKDAINEDGSIKPQGIDQSKLVPLLTAALQEALQKIEDLEGRLTAAGL